VIALVGGIGLGLVGGWLLAQLLAEPARRRAAAGAGALATAAVAAEAALLAGRGAAYGLLAATGLGALLRATFVRAIARNAVTP
jgi:hypothetical protein